jgi:hypothetical protein
MGPDGQVDTSLGHPVSFIYARITCRSYRKGENARKAHPEPIVWLLARSAFDEQELGRQIGEAGRDFAKEHWRWEVMQSYMFRVLLE